MEWDPRSVVQVSSLEIVQMDLALMVFSRNGKEMIANKNDAA